MVSSLPTIGGYDLDSALSNGMGYFNTYANAVWPIRDVMIAFTVLLGYYLIKALLKFFLGHRAPGSH